MNHDAMKAALAKRKNSGVNITLVLGSDDDEQKNPDSKELAPEVKDTGAMADEMNPGGVPMQGHPDEAKDMELIKSVLSKDEKPDSGFIGKAHALMKQKLKK